MNLKKKLVDNYLKITREVNSNQAEHERIKKKIEDYNPSTMSSGTLSSKLIPKRKLKVKRDRPNL